VPDAGRLHERVVVGDVDQARAGAVGRVGERDRDLALERQRPDEQLLALADVEAAEDDGVGVARDLRLRQQRFRAVRGPRRSDGPTLADGHTCRVAEAAVRLRAFRADELDLLMAQRDDTVPSGREDEARRRMRQRIGNRGKFVDGRIDLGVEAEGRLVGHVEARAPKGASPPGVFEIGIGIFEEERGRGFGRAAVAELTGHLIAEHDAYRVQASTDLENGAMRAVLEQLGYTFEGVLRGFMPTRDGGRADYAMYGVTRADWEARAG